MFLEFGSGLAGYFWFGTLWGSPHLKAGLGLEDLLLEWLANMAGQLVLAVVGKPQLCRLFQRLPEGPHDMVAGFPPE